MFNLDSTASITSTKVVFKSDVMIAMDKHLREFLKKITDTHCLNYHRRPFRRIYDFFPKKLIVHALKVLNYRIYSNKRPTSN